VLTEVITALQLLQITILLLGWISAEGAQYLEMSRVKRFGSDFLTFFRFFFFFSVRGFDGESNSTREAKAGAGPSNDIIGTETNNFHTSTLFRVVFSINTRDRVQTLNFNPTISTFNSANIYFLQFSHINKWFHMRRFSRI